MRKNGTGEEENEEKFLKNEKRRKIRNLGQKGRKNAEDLFVCLFVFTFRKQLKLLRGLPKWKFVKLKISLGKNREK